MKFRNPFKRKTDPKVEDVIEVKQASTDRKNAMAEKINKMMDDLKHTERRCGILEYNGPERRQTHA